MQGATASSLQQPEGNTTLDHLLSAVPEIMQGIQVLQIQVQTLQVLIPRHSNLTPLVDCNNPPGPSVSTKRSTCCA